MNHQDAPDLGRLENIPELYTRFYSQRRFAQWRSLFTEAAMVVRVDHLGRQRVMDIEQAVRAFANHALASQSVIETWHDVELREQGQLAHIRARYRLQADGELREGTDWLTLLRHAGEWKIVCLAYEQTRFVPRPGNTDARLPALPPESPNLADGVAQQASLQPAATALYLTAGEVSFETLDRLVWRTVALLVENGIRPGDVLALSFRDEFPAILAMLASARLGATIYWIGQGSGALAGRLLADTNARMLLSDQPLEVGELSCLVIDPDGLANGPAPVDTRWRDPAPVAPWMIAGGSGSTGRPKRIPLSHRQFAAQGAVYQRVLNLAPGDRVASLYPLDSVVTRERYLDALSYGAALVFRSPAEAPLEWLASCAVSVVWAPVVQVELLLQQRRGMPRPTLPKLRAFMVGSSTVSQSLRRRIQAALTEQLHVYYGMNELGLATLAAPNELYRSAQTVGCPPAEVELEIVDAEACRLPVGEIGRVRVRSPGLVEGYLEDQEATQRAFRDGWFYPGDLGRLNADGSLDYCGRADHMMILNGTNIYPAEIEQVMSRHPSVRDAAVMPVRHHWHQDLPVCVVSLFKDAQVSEQCLMDFATEQLAWRRPRYLLIADEIPRTDQGKLLRKELADWIGTRLDSLASPHRPSDIARSAFGNASLRVAFGGRNVAFDILHYAERTPDAPALLLPEREISYRELNELLEKFSAYLLAQGVKAGDLIGVSAADELTLVLTQLAITRVGACIFSLPRSYTAFQRQAAAQRSGIRLLVTDDPVRFAAGVPTIAVDRRTLAATKLPVRRVPLPVHPVVPWLLITGSGSTGEPKLIPITHTQARERSRRAVKLLELDASDRVATLSHFDFSHAKFRLLEAFHVGAACALPVWGKAGMLASLQQRSLSVLYACVFHVEQILDGLPDDAETVLQGTRILEVTSSTVSDDLRQRIRRHLTPNLYVRYGINEAGPVSIATPAEVAAVPGCVGKVVDGVRVQIVDREGAPLPNGEIGAIRIRGEGVVSAYLDNPDANRRLFVDGWFLPGDLGKISPAGDLIYYGRADHMMIKNGMNIYPAEIEQVVGGHGAVRDVAVLPFSHRIHQDVPMCAVVMNPGMLVSESELLAYARARLGARGPERVFCFERIPRNHEGKLLRRELKEMLLQRFGA